MNRLQAVYRGGLFLAMFLTAGCGEHQPTPEELVELALNAPSSTERARAAVQLADYGEEAKPHLRRVLADSTQEDVQAACIEGLGKLWDYESMDLLIGLVEDGYPKIRGRAAVVVTRMIGRDRRYRAGAPLEERLVWVRHVKQDWETIRTSPPSHFDELKERLRASHESPR